MGTLTEKVLVLVTFKDDHKNTTVVMVPVELDEGAIFEKDEGVWKLTFNGERQAREQVTALYGKRDYFLSPIVH